MQSAVVVSSTPGGTVFLEPQAVTLTELPGGTVQTIPAGSTFEGIQPFLWPLTIPSTMYKMCFSLFVCLFFFFDLKVSS